MKPTMSQRDRRRFLSCCVKRSTGSVNVIVVVDSDDVPSRASWKPRSRPWLQRRLVAVEVHARKSALRFVVDLPQVHWGCARDARDEVRRELLLASVVLRRRVVVELASEGDLVLRRGELLLELRRVAG